MKKIIAVSGSSGGDENLTEDILGIAEKVGYLIGKKGGILVCGGLSGIMEAASKGAKKAGGITVGILPYEKEKANRYIDIPIPTYLGFYRNYVLVSSADSVISICGRWGTLNETAFSISIGKPTIILAGTGGISDIFSSEEILNKFKRKPSIAKTPEEAVDLAFTLKK